MSLSVSNISGRIVRRLGGGRKRRLRPEGAPRPEQPKRRRRLGMLLSVGVSGALILYAGPNLVSEVMDRSYIRLLQFPVDAVQEAALEKLAERRPERALVPMIQLFAGRGRLAVDSSNAIVDFGEIAVPSLVEAASDSNPRIRYWAVRTLGKIGRPAGASAAVLAGALRDPVAIVRHNALTALPEVDQRVAVEAITGFLSFEDADSLGRILAIQVLESLGREAASALPALEQLIRDVDPADEVKPYAVQAVRTLRSAREI